MYLQNLSLPATITVSIFIVSRNVNGVQTTGLLPTSRAGQYHFSLDAPSPIHVYLPSLHGPDLRARPLRQDIPCGLATASVMLLLK